MEKSQEVLGIHQFLGLVTAVKVVNSSTVLVVFVYVSHPAQPGQVGVCSEDSQIMQASVCSDVNQGLRVGV